MESGHREFLIITYRTDREKLGEIVPEPLEIVSDLVKFEFIRMPDSTAFGDYTEAGQVIPIRFGSRIGNCTLNMFLNDHSPIAAGRELRGFPKKLAGPTLRVETDTLVGTLAASSRYSSTSDPPKRSKNSAFIRGCPGSWSARRANSHGRA